jgi:hypothetical protein
MSAANFVLTPAETRMIQGLRKLADSTQETIFRTVESCQGSDLLSRVVRPHLRIVGGCRHGGKP